MLLRPELLKHAFVVERRRQTIAEGGRKVLAFVPTGHRIRGVLAEAKSTEVERWKQLQHPVTHTIVVTGAQQWAKIGDRLILRGRKFYVQGIDDVGSLRWYTQIFVEERSDEVG